MNARSLLFVVLTLFAFGFNVPLCDLPPEKLPTDASLPDEAPVPDAGEPDGELEKKLAEGDLATLLLVAI